jgi:dTDP-4-dehydrorhamnose reductase
MADPRPVAWITGSRGLIGNDLVRMAAQCAPAWEVRGLTRAHLDLCDRLAVRRLFDEQSPRLIIHCAALSRSPECERYPDLARRVNVEATAELAGLASEIPLIFFSSDLVFDGRQGNYVETDPVNPLSVYAETKVAAEHVVLSNPRHTVVRTSLNGGTSPSGNRSFNEEMRRAWEAGEVPKLFVDEFRSPIPAEETARAIWALVAAEQPGLYHLAGAERLSRFQIGELLAARWARIHPRFEAGSLRDYAGAPRPPDTSLDCTKLQALLPFKLPGLREWLARNPSVVF